MKFPPQETAPDGTAYHAAGPRDAPVMVLVHGLGLCSRLWHPHLEALAADWRVICYDLYGHGTSAPLRGEAGLSAYSGQIEDLLDHLGVERAVIVGFSIGGMINRRFAIDNPGRTAGLVILNAPHARSRDEQARVEERARDVGRDGGMATMDAAIERWFTAPYRDRESETISNVRAWRARADTTSYAGAAMVLATGVGELLAPWTGEGIRALVMTCENDTGSTPAMSGAIAAQIPGARLQIIPGLKHLGLLERPDAFTGPIRAFCKEISS